MGWFTGTEQTKSKYVQEQEDTEDVQEQEDTEESYEETYDMGVECDNCGNEEEFDIPCGTLVSEYVKGKKCSICDCLLRKA